MSAKLAIESGGGIVEVIVIPLNVDGVGRTIDDEGIVKVVGFPWNVSNGGIMEVIDFDGIGEVDVDNELWSQDCYVAIMAIPWHSTIHVSSCGGMWPW